MIQTKDYRGVEFAGVKLAEVTSARRNNEAELERISELVEMLGGPEGGEAFDFEKAQLKEILRRKAELEYPVIDTSFLSMQSHTTVKSVRVGVPRFSLYQLYGEGRFVAGVNEYGKRVLKFGPDRENTSKWIHMFSGNSGSIDETFGEIFVPEIFSQHLQKAIDFPQEAMDLNGRGHYSLALESRFNGIIPLETRQRIATSRETFPKEDLYLIAETSPEQWTKTSFRSDKLDPLVIGVASGKAFLIDVFDATTAERYVSSEFTTNPVGQK